MYRVICCAVLFAVAAALPTAAPAAAAKKKVQCVKRSGDTIYRDRTLRVIRTVKTSKADPDAETVRITFCKPGTTKAPTALTTFANDLDGSLTVMGVTRGGSRYLALELDEQTGTTDATDVFVYDLTTRKRTFAYGSENGFEHVVTDGGGVALLEAGTLTVFDGAGQRTLGGGASALAASGDVVYWTAGGGAPHAATLSGEAKREL